MLKVENQKNNMMLLRAVFKGDELPQNLVEKANKVTEYFDKNEAVVFLGEEKNYNYDTVFNFAKTLFTNQVRDLQIDLDSFVKGQVCIPCVTKAFTHAYNYVNADIYSAKTSPKPERYQISLLSKEPTQRYEGALKEANVLSDAVNYARNLQILPPNICNSEYLAETVLKDLSVYKNLKISVLTKKEIQELGMGLLLSVNRGSMYEPRVVVIEYNGNPESSEKTVYVGKGITFDSGGYSLKPSRSLIGMKFDMSGSVFVASAMKAIAQLQPKTNVSAIMCITDNRVNGDASLPDSVWKSMNGKTVEINNTDAEGRLVMADGITYAVRNLKATRIVDVATLTGAILVALGSTYTGVWSTTEKGWEELSKAANEQHELVWRMPLDDAFGKEIKNSVIADLKNTDLSGAGGGSSSAAMFLKEFTEGVEYIHLDVAGTAEQGGRPTGVMVKTLVQLALNSK
ncbi:M17 family metallopeptidase [Mycoplasmopsis felis]|uniref:M17 family metallopeptidase n=1 Tax=Mycoplasmopsis felis TaxID=33923 RepID=UPI002AF6C642|nr:leucyl aminopeptidase family protein [Mycoplasmopsis felis]WQQ01758.1 leucyl aminopeptidase family protein [Mycoplasmopsis felis]WQQ02200.1 leucyl aminopeptidase family protein [Mycoplasmopsis felis]WQQ03719.1 leucyl aminopeptidase family protein [Mycoplasmopsis felis]WQQ04914.1 leucyl aminopeptidase family protein [Mycoplasmopsis felis]WQQ07111.1 leucyl aminopeptidase family protein [Mycoplasmopsis felis]